MTRRSRPGLLERTTALDHQRVDDRVFERARDIGLVLIGSLAKPLQRVQREGLQAAEAEVEPGPVRHRSRKTETRRVSALGEPRNSGAAGIAEAKHLGGFVERFAGRIVDRLADDFVFADRIDAHELRVPARNEQCDERHFRLRIGQQRREQMRFHVMDADGRHIERPRQRSADGGADHQRADQPRPGGIGDAVDVAQRRCRARVKHVASAAEPFCERGHARRVPAPRRRIRRASRPGCRAIRRRCPRSLSYSATPGFVAGSLDTQHTHRAAMVAPVHDAVRKRLLRFASAPVTE